MKNGTETVNDFLNGLQEGNEHLVDVARKLTEDEGGKVKENITFALQKRVLQPEPLNPPVRAESPRRAHEFYSAESFVEYLKENKTTKTVVLANVDECKIMAVLDEGKKDGFETIVFRPQIHPLFAPWHRLLSGPVPVQGFALFLLQNKRTIAAPEAAELSMLFSQIRASQKITMHKGIGKSSINGLVCEVSIVGKVENQEVEIPDLIELFVPLYIDTPSLSVEVDVLVSASDTDVFVSCSSSDLKVKTVDAFEGMLRQVREIEGIVIGFGSVSTEPWDYLR